MRGMKPTRRAGSIAGGVLLVVLLGAGVNRLREGSGDAIALSDTSVLVAAKPPSDAFFPLEFLITNDFQPITDVHVSCTVERFVTGEVDFVDTETSVREIVPVMTGGAQHPFRCAAPPELSPPFQLAAVRRARVSVEVLFSVVGRRRPLGVRQSFDLVGDPVQRSLWQPDRPVLLR
jgi:hypothetical protein